MPYRSFKPEAKVPQYWASEGYRVSLEADLGMKCTDGTRFLRYQISCYMFAGSEEEDGMVRTDVDIVADPKHAQLMFDALVTLCKLRDVVYDKYNQDYAYILDRESDFTATEKPA